MIFPRTWLRGKPRGDVGRESWLRGINLRREKEWLQGHSQPIAQHFDGQELGVLAFAL